MREQGNDIEELDHMTCSIQSELASDHFIQTLLHIQTLLAHPGLLQEALKSLLETEMLCAGTLDEVGEKTKSSLFSRLVYLKTWTAEMIYAFSNQMRQ